MVGFQPLFFDMGRRSRGTVRPINHRHYWDKQAYERLISRERFGLDRSGGIAHLDLRYLCKELDAARQEQWLWSQGVHEKQIGIP